MNYPTRHLTAVAGAIRKLQRLVRSHPPFGAARAFATSCQARVDGFRFGLLCSEAGKEVMRMDHQRCKARALAIRLLTMRGISA